MLKRVRITEYREANGAGYMYRCRGLFYGFSFMPYKGASFKEDIAKGLYTQYTDKQARGLLASSERVSITYVTIEE